MWLSSFLSAKICVGLGCGGHHEVELFVVDLSVPVDVDLVDEALNLLLIESQG